MNYVSGVPPPTLQQMALLAMGVLGSLGDTILSKEETVRGRGDKNADSDIAMQKKEMEEESKIQAHLLFETMPIYLYGKVMAIDRLIYFCCTGAYAPKISMGVEDNDLYEKHERPEVVASLLSTYSI